ncbi:MAG TPA: DUF6191 domain-containing protein [Dermatophilaceae bacterium]|nr:DUF6191 domain-containing protein [Dermatophilaceae bacterium]
MDPFGEVMEIFAPGFRYLAEEKDRKRLTMQISGRGDDPLGVDLDKGVVRITRPTARPADQE